MQRRSFQLLLSLTIIGAVSSVVWAQGFRRGGPMSGGPGGRGGLGRLEAAGLKLGSAMPDLTIFDQEGKPFETASLRGKYSVVVFGCLT